MKICAIQLRPAAGDMAANIDKHLQLIDLALAHGTDLVYFPELSLTGYEPRLAQALATDERDPRLTVFQQRSDTHNIIIGVGLPLAVAAQVQIGMVWFAPDTTRRRYAKQQLHTDELPFFVPGNQQILLETAAHKLAPAICYESLQWHHAAEAAGLGADVYLASVAKAAGSVARAGQHYAAVARQYSMTVLMANCVGPADDFVSVGQTSAWNRRGDLLAQMDTESEGMVLLDTIKGESTQWPR